jgi:hypothetical protein
MKDGLGLIDRPLLANLIDQKSKKRQEVKKRGEMPWLT